MATTDSADSTDRKMAEKHTIWVLLIFQRKISRLVFSSSGQRLCSACCTRNTSRSAGTPLRRTTTCWSTTNHGGGVPWITRASRPRGGLSTRSSTLGRALNSSRKSNSLHWWTLVMRHKIVGINSFFINGKRKNLFISHEQFATHVI